MVSERQWSVPSSSIVVSTHDLYILYNVYCVVQEICTYCTVYTVLYMKSVRTVRCVLCCTCVVHDICVYLHCLRCYITFRLCICIHTQMYVLLLLYNYMYGGCVYVGVVFLCMLVVMAISSHHIISHV